MSLPHDRLVVAGGAGFLGRSLVAEIGARFREVVVLTRTPRPAEANVRYAVWDAQSVGDWAHEISGASALVNLVGRTVDCRKTEANKRVILQSRVDSVRVLAEAVRAARRPPRVWVQAATAHIYGDTDDELLDETSPIGTGFAPDVGVAWEAALTQSALPPETRTVILRISFVLGRLGGPLQILARLARLGLGGRIGSGRQWMSWIHVADLNAIIRRAIDDDTMRGVYIATAPEPETNATFMRELRRATHRPWSPPAPAPFVRLGALLMRTDPELALLGRRLRPGRLLNEGFTFQFPHLRGALADLI